MSRLFSPTNLDRHRKLARNVISVAERHQMLELLAEEMKAFRREARSPLTAQAHIINILIREPDAHSDE